jgi:hypothetical protein
MARNRRAVLRRLSVEQEMFLLCGNLLTRSFRDESDEAAERRLFGSRAAAAAAWEQHRDALLACDPVAGRRPYGWWRHERRRAVPPTEQQPELLRALGCLSELEEAQLEAWRRMVPEPPDHSIDHSVSDPTIREDNHDAEPLEKAGDGSQTALGERAAADRRQKEAPGRGGAEGPSTPAPGAGEKEVTPQILPIGGPLGRRRPAELEGWE